MASYAATLHAAGVLIAGEVLQPSDVATTLRLADGRLQVQDGPFADTKEQLGGTVAIDVPDLDAAIEWASRAPALEWGGTVEIRPGATHTRGRRVDAERLSADDGPDRGAGSRRSTEGDRFMLVSLT